MIIRVHYHLRMRLQLLCEAQGKASFCSQKEAKKLLYAGPWALSPTLPLAQHKTSFCGAFFKKRLLSLRRTAAMCDAFIDNGFGKTESKPLQIVIFLICAIQ
jgi:hypothetical protein